MLCTVEISTYFFFSPPRKRGASEIGAWGGGVLLHMIFDLFEGGANVAMGTCGREIKAEKVFAEGRGGM